MKRLLILLSLIPQFLYAQFQVKEFMLLDNRNVVCQDIELMTKKDTVISLNIHEPISSFFISGENGFARVIFENTDLRLYELSTPFSSLVYTDNNRSVTDDDMDGYYTWGSGTKPSNLPAWIPDEQDGDDTNPIIGAINEYGICATLTELPAITWTINTNVSHSVSDNYTYPNIIIQQNGSLTLNASTIMMKSNSIIKVKNGGKLILNGGLLSDANIVVESGGTLIINNGGIIRLRHNGQFLTEVGAIVSINQGNIE